jgi:glycosyltransferase involved in cell wall biosynthesis
MPIMKLSIITINRNNAPGLQKTINSILEQSIEAYEYIIIDGASTDESIEIIKKHSGQITEWVSEPDHGIYNAINKGIKIAKGDYCLFLHSGDVLYNNCVLQRIGQCNINSDIACFDAVVNEKNKDILVASPRSISFYTFYHHTILHQATLIRRSLFDKYGFYNEKYRIVSDWEFFVRVLFIHNASFQSFPITLSVFDTGGISSDPNNFTISKAEREEILLNNYEHFLPDYNLLRDKPVYTFLKNMESFRFLRSMFIFSIRILNKVINIFKD